jgi:hypothetical protein
VTEHVGTRVLLAGRCSDLSVALAVVFRLEPRRPEFDPRSMHVGFMVDDKVALGRDFLGFPMPLSFHRCRVVIVSGVPRNFFGGGGFNNFS